MFGKEDGFGKIGALSAVAIALALVAIQLAGAVYAQAEEIEPTASEKISGNIADYKAAHPDWVERIDKPKESLPFWFAIIAIFVICSMLYTMISPIVDYHTNSAVDHTPGYGVDELAPDYYCDYPCYVPYEFDWWVYSGGEMGCWWNIE